MDEGRRRAYLKAMGITPWVLREAPEPAGSAVLQDEGEASPVPESEAPARPEMPVPESDTSGLDWEALTEAVRDCRRCPLHAGRTQAVFGVGNPDADWLFVGEAPGREEDRLGEPFVGRAGQLLDAMLAAAGHSRQEVYIANILKSRPPNNRDPEPEEIAACLPWLRRQIELVRPRVMMLVGRIAAQTLLETTSPLGRLRGQVHQVPELGIPAVVTYHPAYLLRSPQQKPKAWADLCLALDVLEGRQ